MLLTLNRAEQNRTEQGPSQNWGLSPFNLKTVWNGYLLALIYLARSSSHTIPVLEVNAGQLSSSLQRKRRF